MDKENAVKGMLLWVAQRCSGPGLPDVPEACPFDYFLNGLFCTMDVIDFFKFLRMGVERLCFVPISDTASCSRPAGGLGADSS